MSNNDIPDECECCPTTRESLLALQKIMRVTNKEYDGDLKNYHGMWMCPKCYLKEIELKKESVMNAENRVNQARQEQDAQVLIAKAREIDQSLQVSTDLFNAKTIAIMEIKQAIDSDDKVENKQFALAQAITERINHFQSKISKLRSDLVEANSGLRAHQEYLNTFANQLRQEERDKLRIMDINYEPNRPITKPPKDRAVIKVTKKFDKNKIRELSAQYNVPMEMIQGTIVARKMMPEEAAKFCAALLHPNQSN